MVSDITPSASEYEGLYNAFNGSGSLNSISALPTLTLEEAKEVTNDLYDLLVKYASQRGLSKDELKQYYASCVLTQLEDRTASISFIDPRDCISNLFLSIRDYLINVRPLWRVKIPGTAHSTTVLIYPDAIRLGELFIQTKLLSGFEELIDREIEMRGSGRGFELMQYAALRPFVAAAITHVVGLEVLLIKMFDNYKGDYSKTSVWSLCSSSVTDLEINNKCEYMLGDRFLVKSDGDFGYHVLDNAPYWLRQWIFQNEAIPERLVFRVFDENFATHQIEASLPSS